MTKRARIEALAREGKTKEEICEITDFSRGYVSNVLCDIRHPGLLRAAQSRWAEKTGWRSSRAAREARRQWRKEHRKDAAEHRRRTRTGHQKATLPLAQKRGQDWTPDEIWFLKKHGATMTIRQLALALGRTYVGVQLKTRRIGLDLRGEKMGAGAQYFKNGYRIEEVKACASE